MLGQEPTAQVFNLGEYCNPMRNFKIVSPTPSSGPIKSDLGGRPRLFKSPTRKFHYVRETGPARAAVSRTRKNKLPC